MPAACGCFALDEPYERSGYSDVRNSGREFAEYRGALVLVTHDRYMLDRVSTVCLGWMDLVERNVCGLSAVEEGRGAESRGKE